MLLKSVQSALSDLKRPLNVYSPSAIIGLSLLNSILMARFLKQSFSQTCLKETDNGKLQQFNYSRSLITNRGTVERGIGRRIIKEKNYAPLKSGKKCLDPNLKNEITRSILKINKRFIAHFNP